MDTVNLNKPLPDEITHPLFARFMEGVRLCLDESCAVSGDRDRLTQYVQYMGGSCCCGDDAEVPQRLEFTHFVATRVGSLTYQFATQNGIRPLQIQWIEDCWSQGSLLATERYFLPPFAGLVISVTGLSASTRHEILRLTNAYGGQYTPNLSKKCTHLLASSPQGIKYRYAIEWGIHTVTTPWFFDSINSQYCHDETAYFLPLTEASREALFHPLSTSTRDLSRLSPALRKKHLMQCAKLQPDILRVAAGLPRSRVHLRPSESPVTRISKREMNINEPVSSDDMILDSFSGPPQLRVTLEALLQSIDYLIERLQGLTPEQQSAFVAACRRHNISLPSLPSIPQTPLTPQPSTPHQSLVSSSPIVSPYHSLNSIAPPRAHL